jgi:hypothetical protein
MEIHRAAEFGLLGQKLGIKPRHSRVTYQMTEHGVVIWDLAEGKKYTVVRGNPNATMVPFDVPSNIQKIIGATDDALKKRYSESWQDGWSEERETLFTELNLPGNQRTGTMRPESLPI